MMGVVIENVASFVKRHPDAEDIRGIANSGGVRGVSERVLDLLSQALVPGMSQFRAERQTNEETYTRAITSGQALASSDSKP